MSGISANNPPAFPLHPHIDAGWPGNQSVGMSLRDYFAGRALAGLLADTALGGDCEFFAQYAYQFADAMLAARQSPTSKGEGDE